MATKKEESAQEQIEEQVQESIKEQRDRLINEIVIAQKAVEKAKLEYKEFSKENPHTLARQATTEEIRAIKQKFDKATLEKHQKTNAVAAQAAAQAAFIAKVKGGE